MALILKRPWTRQPQVAVEPSKKWMALGLVHLVVGGRCVVSNQPLVYNGTIQNTDILGVGPKATSSTNIGAWLAESRLLRKSAGLGDYTIGAFANVPANANRAFLVGSGDAGGTGPQEPYLLVNSTGALVSASGTAGFSGSGVNPANLVSVVDGSPKLYSGRRAGSTHHIQAGSNFSSAAGSSIAVWATTFRFFLGGYITSSSYGLTYAVLPIAFAFDAALSDADLLSLNANPWQLFAPLPRRIWAPSAAVAGTPTLSAATLFNITSTTAQPRVTLTF